MEMIRVVGTAALVFASLLTLYAVVGMICRICVMPKKGAVLLACLPSLFVCAVLILFAADLRTGFLTRGTSRAALVIGWGLRALLAVFVAVFIFLIGRILIGGRSRAAAPQGTAIVLGHTLINGKPSADLRFRLDTARQYAQEHPQASLVLTGGNADGSGQTEAAVMRDHLVACGVARERLILEDRAKTTVENFKNTARLIDPASPVVIISSDYHMDRAVHLAKKAGFSAVFRLPAPSPALYFCSNVLSEAVFRMFA